ncbi:MAG: polysaccharide lyase family protein, partial [Terriglobales bacterium]
MTTQAFLLLSLALLQLTGAAIAQTHVFEIGTRDARFTEFHRNWENGKTVRYVVGRSTPEKDWPAYQPATFDRLVPRSTMQRDWTEIPPQPAAAPFVVEFNLDAKPTGAFTLHLDAIFRYRRPAPPRYSLLINGKYSAGYQLRPDPSPDLWWPNGGEADGNMQYFGYESLDMILPASYFRRGENTLALECKDGFGIFYDRLALTNEPQRHPKLIEYAAVEPSVLYKQTPSGEVELTTVSVRTTRALGKTTLNT